jgi:hypothetical protein
LQAVWDLVPLLLVARYAFLVLAVFCCYVSLLMREWLIAGW